MERAYDKPGEYSEVLKVVDARGRVDYDFAVVLVIDKALDGKASPTIHASYAPTLAAWRERFVAQLAEVRRLGFDEPFIRSWLLYLAFSEAAFAERTLGDHQLLFTLPR